MTYIFQVFLTIGGGTKFIPLTGVTLPLISYGGSSVLTTLIMFAVVEGLCIIREDEAEERRARIKARKRKKKKIRRMIEELEEEDQEEILEELTRKENLSVWDES